MDQGLPFEPDLPDGFRYEREWLGIEEERDLVERIQQRVEFSLFEMRGVVAKRRVAFFGQTYDADRPHVPVIPDFLLPLRGRAATWAMIPAEHFVMALINEYRPGAPIGWHRDAPQYDVVAGVSLLSSCRMKFRPYMPPSQRGRVRSPRRTTHELIVEPRSVYLLAGVSRRDYEHHIPAVDALRYSVTFRTARERLLGTRA